MRCHSARGSAGTRRAPEHASRGRTRVGFCSLRGHLSATRAAYAGVERSRESDGRERRDPVASGVSLAAEAPAQT
jgi:hypothetical protein